jgi:predicted alpha/beta-hydrolase family hydrolase
VSGPIALGGHSYGGRQASMLLADDPTLADALLLLSYPLHPPRRPAQWRTEHFPTLRTPTLFVHGSRDPFGTVAELNEARRLIPGRTDLVAVNGAGHELTRSLDAQLAAIVQAFARVRSG